MTGYQVLMWFVKLCWCLTFDVITFLLRRATNIIPGLSGAKSVKKTTLVRCFVSSGLR